MHSTTAAPSSWMKVRERLSERDPGQPLVGLHAKVFAFEKGSRARVFLGSANATGAAFTRNLEILVELIGSSGKLGIDALCGGTEDEPGLRALFARYSAREPGRMMTRRPRSLTLPVELSPGWRLVDRSRRVTQAGRLPTDRSQNFLTLSRRVSTAGRLLQRETAGR